MVLSLRDSRLNPFEAALSSRATDTEENESR